MIFLSDFFLLVLPVELTFLIGWFFWRQVEVSPCPVGSNVRQSFLVLEVSVSENKLLSLGMGGCHSIYNYCKVECCTFILYEPPSFFFIEFLEVSSHSVNRSETMRNRVFDLFWEFSISFIVALRLENRIPAEISTSSWLNDWTWSFANEEFWLFKVCTHVSYDAHGIACFIWEGFDHLSQSFRPDVFEEPFDVRSG